MTARRRRLAQCRRTAGYTQEDLAHRLGVERSTVARWERGDTEPQPWLRRKIAAAFGISMTDLDRLLVETTPPNTLDSVAGHLSRLENRATSVLPRTAPFRGVDAPDDDPSHLEEFEARVLKAHAARRQLADSRATLVLVGGFAGSGKTEFGRFLSGTTGWALLDKDTLTRPLTESLLMSHGADPNDRHTQTYVRHVRPLEYRALLNAAFGNLNSGVSTILTAPFLREMPDESWLRRVTHRCATVGVDVAMIWVDCDVESMYTYLQARDAARDVWKLDNWDDYLRSVDLSVRPRLPHFVVDNRRNAALSLTQQADRLADLVGHGT